MSVEDHEMVAMLKKGGVVLPFGTTAFIILVVMMPLCGVCVSYQQPMDFASMETRQHLLAQLLHFHGHFSEGLCLLLSCRLHLFPFSVFFLPLFCEFASQPHPTPSSSPLSSSLPFSLPANRTPRPPPLHCLLLYVSICRKFSCFHCVYKTELCPA